MGPWTGGAEGGDRLHLPYRRLLNMQKFVVIRAHASQLQLENATVHALHPANTDCPQCRGRARVRSRITADYGRRLPMLRRQRLGPSNAGSEQRRANGRQG
jgi:hypothetical protein